MLKADRPTAEAITWTTNNKGAFFAGWPYPKVQFWKTCKRNDKPRLNNTRRYCRKYSIKK